MNRLSQLPCGMLSLTMLNRVRKLLTLAIGFIWLAGMHSTFAQTTQFTYQGKLTDNGAPANGSYDFTVALWDAATNGTLIGSPVMRQNTQVVDGIFYVQLDFGAAAFNGSARYLEILVKQSGNPAILPTMLTPRQLITSTPYAIKSLGAVSADSLSVNCVNCITSSQIQSVQGSQVTGNISGSQITGTIPVASVPPGSADYIQNSTSQQASSNFNISGTGKADTIEATTQYNLNGLRILSNAGANNLFAGVNTASVNTGGANSFFGPQAGQNNTTGGNNSFFGSLAGQANTTGSFNAFFGTQAGKTNTTGGSNAFFGNAAGFSNTTGGGNSFFGSSAGQANTTGNNNSFFGASAGASNTTGQQNAFFGRGAGQTNSTGFQNTFFGGSAGQANTTGFSNSFVGYQAGALNTTGQQNAFFGTQAGVNNTTGSSNTFYGYQAGSSNTVGVNNTFIGEHADFFAANPTGDNNTLLGANTFLNSGINNGTAIGANASVTQSNSLILGSINGINGATADTMVGIGTTAPAFRLHIIDPSNAGLRVQTNTTGGKVASFGDKGTFQIDATGIAGGRFLVNEVGFVGINTTSPARRLDVNGTVIIRQLGPTGSNQLCLNAINEVASCSSSRRYKTNIVDYPSGLNLLNRLRPVTFDWRDSGMHDLGLVAEEVAEVEPLLVTHNDKGMIEGVKYDRVSVILLNAVKEQQALIMKQQQQLDTLKKLVCLDHPEAEMCK